MSVDSARAAARCVSFPHCVQVKQKLTPPIHLGCRTQSAHPHTHRLIHTAAPSNPHRGQIRRAHQSEKNTNEAPKPAFITSTCSIHDGINDFICRERGPLLRRIIRRIAHNEISRSVIMDLLFISWTGTEQPTDCCGSSVEESVSPGRNTRWWGGGFLGRVCTEFSKNIYVLISDVRDSRRII